MTGVSPKRYYPLDVLRGLTVAFMCIVNNPGTWQHVYPVLRHSPWDGCTPTDLVYPFFIFCMGVAMAFSFARYDGLGGGGARKVLKRSLLIFLVGFLLNIFPFYPIKVHDVNATFGENYLYWMQHWRILGVLQRIALSYLIAGLVILGCRKDVKKVALIGLGLAIFYTAILLTGGDLTLEGNAARKLDIAIFGENHLYQGYGIPFDPEGLLGSLTGACTAILGFLTGSMIRKDMTFGLAPGKTIIKLLVWGAGLIAAALLLNIWIPINKPLWSASYVLFAGGLAAVALGIVSTFTELLGWKRVFVPAEAMGTNALTAFVIAGIIPRIFRIIGWHPGSLYFSANEFMSLCYAVLFMLVVFSILWLMYKRKIVIKL